MLDKRLNFIEIEKKILAKWEKEKLFSFKEVINPSVNKFNFYTKHQNLFIFG